jgi:WhiB family redox-sensing transcriptional regulator
MTGMGQNIDGRSWMARAACRGEAITDWFADDPHVTGAARSVCERCIVKADCLEYALAHDIRHGVWGGASERQRLAIARRRARVAAFVAGSEAAS